MMDICSGNQRLDESVRKAYAADEAARKPRGNFNMCSQSTDPISYLKSIGVSSLFRFILSHPDMDHMDGLDRLCDEFRVYNFWDTGSPRPKPDFGWGSKYLEADWDRFERIRSGQDNRTSTGVRQAGARFAYANRGEDGTGGGDGLHILSPTKQLINDPDFEDDINEGSYVISYLSSGGKIILPGDAHDAAWEYIINNDRTDIENCAFMLAPHHGRHSNRSYDFLDYSKPKLTLIGCSPSDYIEYDQWRRRGLDYITSNQAGNVVLNIGEAIDVYIENEKYVEACGKTTRYKNDQGYTFYKTIR
jgi:beta-lactamase superfamily II metal-dependent hydrolase